MAGEGWEKSVIGSPRNDRSDEEQKFKRVLVNT